MIHDKSCIILIPRRSIVFRCKMEPTRSKLKQVGKTALRLLAPFCKNERRWSDGKLNYTALSCIIAYISTSHSLFMKIYVTFLLIKDPVPVPSVVLKFAIVGFAAVFQQTPRAVTAAPPSVVILPPLVAVVPVMALITEVLLITGAVAAGGGGGGGGAGAGVVDLLQPAKNNVAVITRNVT